MDFENFFYVILAIIYFLSRVMKGRKKMPPSEPSETTEGRPAKKPVTFEDLLKEFGVEQVEEEKEAESAYEEEIEEEPVESPRYSDEESRSIFEQSIREAEQAGKEIPQADKRLVFKEFEAYQETEEEHVFTSELTEMLKSADGAKKAVVLSEILNRKY